MYRAIGDGAWIETAMEMSIETTFCWADGRTGWNGSNGARTADNSGAVTFAGVDDN